MVGDKVAKNKGVFFVIFATYPYQNDPTDSNLRIAPSLPPVEELEKAMEVLTTSVKLAALEKLMKE